jgi:YVTN family beta-propeller protein
MTKASQTITFAPPASLTSAQSPYTLTATTSSGLTISFTSTTASICTVSGNLLTVSATGSCSVTANQPGNSTYAPAPSVSRTITITKAPQTITFAPPLSLTNTQSPYTLSATASSGLAVTVTSSTPGICTVSALRLTLVAAGTCTLVASQAGSSVYERAMNVQARIAITGNPTFTVSTKYQTGRYSQGIAINRSTAYVTNPNDGTISVIDLKQNTSTKFTIGGNPWCIRINGENAYVSDLYSNRISIVSLLTQKVVGIINVVGPYNFIIEGGKIYVAGGHQNEGGLDNKLSVFDLSSLRLINSVPIGGNPTSVAVVGNLAFIANSASTYVSVIDLSTFILVENIFLPGAPSSVFATNGNLYVTLPGRNTLAVVKLENRQLVDEITVGTSPFGVSVYKNSYAFVTNSLSGNLSIVNLSTKMELARITISDYPNYVVFDEEAAYVLSSGDGQNLGALTKIRMMWL